MTPWTAYRHRLIPFSPTELLRGAAAAQLVSQNANHFLRLEAFTQAVLDLPPTEAGRPPSTDELRELINAAGAASGFSVMEDPSDNAFTERLVVAAGEFVVFPGIEEEAVHSVEQLLTAALHLLEEQPGKAQLLHTVRSCLALLAVSHDVFLRGAAFWPQGEAGRGVWIPDSTLFEGLQAAATYSERQLRDVLESRALELIDLTPFIASPGAGSGAEPELDGGVVAHQPLIAIRDRYVVFPVGHVLRAIRHLLLTSATATPALEARYYELAWRQVQVSLRRMGIVRPLEEFGGAEHPLLRTRAFVLDEDKVLHLAMVADPFANYRPHDLSSPSDLSAVQLRLDGSSRALETLDLPGLTQAPRVFSLVIFEGIGNLALLPSLSTETAYALSVGVSDLDVMSFEFEGDPMGLLYFAEAVGDLHRRQRLGMTGTLDLFAAYRDHQRSFYLSDQAPPAALFLMPGGAGDVRRERRAELDTHGAPYGPVVIKVSNYFRDPSIALYQSLDMLMGGLLNFLVEGRALRLWVVAERAPGVQVSLPLIVETLAFWLWRLEAHLHGSWPQAHRKVARIVVTAVQGLPHNPDARMPGVRVLTDRPATTVVVQVDETFTANFNTPDNLPEQTWMREVLTALLQVVEGPLPQGSAPAMEAAIASVMGDPLMKKITVMNGASVLLDGQGLARARLVQPHQESRALDTLANALGVSYPVGTAMEGPDASTLLNAAVAKLFEEFVHLAGTLDARQALSVCIRRHEAVIHQTASRQFTFDFTRRCFAGHALMESRLQEEYGRNNRAAIASRFVIEYLATQPPRGHDPFTLERYDQLVARAALIHSFGTNSDLAHHGLARVKAEILPSGRLASARGAFEPAQTAFEANMFSEVTRDSESLARAYLGGTSTEEPFPEQAVLDAAVEGELGWPLSDILNFLDALSDLPGADELPRQLPVSDFLSTASRDLGWPESKVRGVLDLLILAPRPHFLRPPTPWRREDVEPWRFNRALSYLRRPVALLADPDRLVWGPRAVASASHYLLDLLQSGRMKATSTPLRQWLGEINRQRGLSFNRQVASFLRRLNIGRVQEQVKVFGQVRMSDDLGQDLGDIDVIVVDERRRMVSCIECKNFAVARTAAEIHALFERLEKGVGPHRPIVERHARRTAHVRRHLPAVLEHYGLGSEGWQVEGLIVFNRDSVAYYLSSSPLPVLSFEQFIERMQAVAARPQ